MGNLHQQAIKTVIFYSYTGSEKVITAMIMGERKNKSILFLLKKINLKNDLAPLRYSWYDTFSYFFEVSEMKKR